MRAFWLFFSVVQGIDSLNRIIPHFPVRPQVPLVGEAYVADFQSSKRLQKVLLRAKEELARTFAFTTKLLNATNAGSHDGLSCCISDPRNPATMF